MSFQLPVQPKSSANGFGRRRPDREVGSGLDTKLQSGKPNLISSTIADALTGSQIVADELSLQDRLLYLTTCLIGQHVEVQVTDGSIYSGIFHAANSKEDFGVILKMAGLTKDGSSQGLKKFVSQAPSKTLNILGREIVQVMAKDVAITKDELTDKLLHDKHQELLVDSFISQSRHREVERELKPWVPDEDVPPCPELENIFENPWNRNWDQFETNETLFGVKSTYDEELYTTKLEKGPRMRELELQATRIAREIEGEETKDLHLAEERGIQIEGDIDIDEETKFSSVYRGKGFDDSGYEEEDIMLNLTHIETFGGSFDSIVNSSPTGLASWRKSDDTQVSTTSSSLNEAPCAQTSTGNDRHGSGIADFARQFASELPVGSFTTSDGSRTQDTLYHERNTDAKAREFTEEEMSTEGAKYLKSDEGQQETSTFPEGISGKTQGQKQSVNSCGRVVGSTLSVSSSVSAFSASSGLGLSPSSSAGSLSSEKSTLNPHAKEFKLNPNAKSFVPSQTPLRPPSPVSDGSFYYPNASAVPQMHGMPVGMGIGPSYPGQQHVMYSPQVAPGQSPQTYFHPGGPQYGQQMLVGPPRQVYYMPGYPPEMPYK